MEAIRGKRTLCVDATVLHDLAQRHSAVALDIGTGDGRFVRRLAQLRPELLAIGLDTCRENMREHSRRAPANALFVVADALALPAELAGLAGEIAINFPWGSLLGGLLDAHPGLVSGLVRVAMPEASLAVRLNAGALMEQGWEFDAGAERVAATLDGAGFHIASAATVDAAVLRRIQSTWAKRLAFGRDPRAVCLEARWPSRLRMPA